MSSVSVTDQGTEILARSIEPQQGDLAVEAARAILRFELSPQDRNRVNELAAEARAGTLTPEGRAELDEYERIACFLELMHSKARRSLKQAGISP